MDESKLYKELVTDVTQYVNIVLSEYHHRIPEQFYNDIVQDVIDCSAYHDGYYNDSDIQLAFQRVVVEMMGVEI